MQHTGNRSVFGNMTRMVILLAVCATPNLAAQEVTHLSSWTKYVDPMASKSSGDAIAASAPAVNLPGARVRVIATCTPVENPATGARPRYIDYRISVTGATLDSQDRSISHQSGTWLAPIVTYSSERIILIKIKYGGNDPYIGQTNPIDPHSFSIPSYFPSGVPSPTIVMNDALFEFPANGTEIILGISGTQPVFAAFASHCYAPTVDELAAIKRSADQKAAAEAAAAARQEQARIAREQAAEEARLVTVKEDLERERIAKIIAKAAKDGEVKGVPTGDVNQVASFLARVTAQEGGGTLVEAKETSYASLAMSELRSLIRYMGGRPIPDGAAVVFNADDKNEAPYGPSSMAWIHGGLVVYLRTTTDVQTYDSKNRTIHSIAEGEGNWLVTAKENFREKRPTGVIRQGTICQLRFLPAPTQWMYLREDDDAAFVATYCFEGEGASAKWVVRSFNLTDPGLEYLPDASTWIAEHIAH